MDEQTIINIKFILYCFENMYGLKINYEKSEVFVMGYEEGEATKISGMFNYKKVSCQ